VAISVVSVPVSDSDVVAISVVSVPVSGSDVVAISVVSVLLAQPEMMATERTTVHQSNRFLPLDIFIMVDSLFLCSLARIPFQCDGSVTGKKSMQTLPTEG
jgi:hypothetical protein